MTSIHLEAKKYRRQGLGFLLALLILLHFLVAGVQLFKAGSDLSESLRVLRVLDGLALFQIVLLPILLASLVSMSVQLENRHQMWKVLQASGLSFRTIFRQKLVYVYSRYVLAQFLEWVLIFSLVVANGLGDAIIWSRLLWYGVSVLAVSFAIVEVQFFLSLRANSHLLPLAVALLGSLVSIILVFLPFPLMWASPYAWYGYLVNLVPEQVGDSFVFHLREMNTWSLLLGLAAGFIFHLLNEQGKVRV